MKIATIGFFDGVHKGHQYLFEHLRKEADERGLEPLIVTFDTHPRAVLQSDYMPQILTSLPEREALLKEYGEVLVLPFEEVQPLTAAQFMEYLRDEQDVAVILMGYDHRFGSDKLTRIQDYRRLAQSLDLEIVSQTEFVEGEWHVSSTEIRQALMNGNILVANELLGRPYAIVGKVVHGKGMGRTIGFPTANIEPLDPHKIIPRRGVYVARVNTPTINDALAFVNIDKNGIIEAHIPSFKGDLYGAQLKLRFVRFLREERQFSTMEDLKEQIKEDIDSIRRQGA
jgi:riboflavin kinase/FMN adenylyltransferase